MANEKNHLKKKKFFIIRRIEEFYARNAMAFNALMNSFFLIENYLKRKKLLIRFCVKYPFFALHAEILFLKADKKSRFRFSYLLLPSFISV